MTGITKQEAIRQARMNASALIAAMDLEQLYGAELQERAFEEGFENLLSEAQAKVVQLIQPKG